MRKLISFLVRYNTAILFIILQVVAFGFIYQASAFQRSKMFTLNAEWTGKSLETYNNIDDYLNLKRINRNLARENARLRATAKDSYFSLLAKRDTAKVAKFDTLFVPQYTFIEARVISSSFAKRNNYITLNKGKIHGIKPDMAVTSSQGVIGVIKDVSNHFSTVIPLLHSQNLISVRFKNNPYFGSLSWSGKDYRYAELSDVPREAPIAVGDTLVTDFRSSSFPADLQIGTVESFEINMETLAYEIQVKLSTNFAALDYVYVIDNLLKEEQLQLEAITTP